jgi:alpha-glucosidase
MSDPWWRQATVYQIYPRSFADGNGDALGDLMGIREHLDYLTALGVTALWLSPFYPSPLHDSGYDVIDPRTVDPMYGTMDDFTELLVQAHARDLRVIVDVVPNHVSEQHPWFQAALASEPGSDARERFHIRDGRGPLGAEPPNNWLSMFGGPAWTRIGSSPQWYLHLFDSTQPDLNWNHPDVRKSWLDTLRFWLDLGVDGFRVDVALGLAKDPTYPDLDQPDELIKGLRLDLDDGSAEAEARRKRVANSPIFDRDEVVEIYAEWRALLNAYPGDRMAVAEAWVTPDRIGRYVSEQTLHQIFGFDFLTAPWHAETLAQRIERTRHAVAEVGALPTWALSNHDTPRVVTRLGGGDIGEQRARALALLTHSLPGSIYVFQGEELGLADVELALADRQDPIVRRTNGAELGRDGARVPLPWSGDAPPYGFSTSAERLWLPQPESWQRFTVAEQIRQPTSTLQQYRMALWLRRAHPGLIDAADCHVSVVGPGHLRIERGCGFTCEVNTGDEPFAVSGEVLLTSDPLHTHVIQTGWCPPNTAVWLQR